MRQISSLLLKVAPAVVASGVIVACSGASVSPNPGTEPPKSIPTATAPSMETMWCRYIHDDKTDEDVLVGCEEKPVDAPIVLPDGRLIPRF